MSEWCEQTSERTSEWPSTPMCILANSGPQCLGHWRLATAFVCLCSSIRSKLFLCYSFCYCLCSAGIWPFFPIRLQSTFTTMVFVLQMQSFGFSALNGYIDVCGFPVTQLTFHALILPRFRILVLYCNQLLQVTISFPHSPCHHLLDDFTYILGEGRGDAV